MSLWDNNETQFARLLCELMATQTMDLSETAASMDLEMDELHELLDRANEVWEAAKARLPTMDLAAEKELAALEEEFERAGGRGVELAERIDELRRETKKFWRVVTTHEMLADDERYIDDDELLAISRACEIGDCSGRVLHQHVEEVDAATMAKLLIKQGTDPEFFGIFHCEACEKGDGGR